MVAPIYLVIHNHTAFWITVAIFVAMSVLLKFFWYDHLKDVDREFSDSELRCVE